MFNLFSFYHLFFIVGLCKHADNILTALFNTSNLISLYFFLSLYFLLPVSFPLAASLSVHRLELCLRIVSLFIHETEQVFSGDTAGLCFPP